MKSNLEGVQRLHREATRENSSLQAQTIQLNAKVEMLTQQNKLLNDEIEIYNEIRDKAGGLQKLDSLSPKGGGEVEIQQYQQQIESLNQ